MAGKRKQPGKHKGLTPKQEKFVEAYAGNASEAARKAGYTGSPETIRQTAHETLTNPHVAKAIRIRSEKEAQKNIASRAQRQAFWTDAMKLEDADMSVRLKASELLGKSEADFLDRIDHGGSVTIHVVDPFARPPRGAGQQSASPASLSSNGAEPPASRSEDYLVDEHIQDPPGSDDYEELESPENVVPFETEEDDKT